jgi:spore cortex formation protein SpoVR/YcgB (stage V sporulation)
MTALRANPISTGCDWTFELLQRYDETIGKLAADEYKLDCYPNQIEIISSEQMLDAYASTGMPIGYSHWSFGKEFLRHEAAYRRGLRGLAYELVINSNPYIAYLMEDNTMAMQALVIAHACYGHNSFFKGNYLFRQWTSADAIIDYLVFARQFVAQCEERFGIERTETLLDACHALSDYGVDRYRRPRPLSADGELARLREREAHAWSRYDDLWRTVPTKAAGKRDEKSTRYPEEPQENLLYFIEKHSPNLEPWEREIVRIVRKLAQYFYPQGQTKLMNEGWATFWHHTLLNRLFDEGRVTSGFMLEFLHHHTNVVTQRGFDEQGYGGMNPYALGFAMFRDIKRICESPDEEDRRWFPEIAGGDWHKVLDFGMRNYKDESFIGQFLSPRLIREFRLFAIADHEDNDYFEVDSIHNDQGYRRVRSLLAAQYNRDHLLPDIQVTRYDRAGDRSLALTHRRHRYRPLSDESDRVMRYVARLWGFPVRLEVVDSDGTEVAVEEYRPA